MVGRAALLRCVAHRDGGDGDQVQGVHDGAKACAHGHEGVSRHYLSFICFSAGMMFDALSADVGVVAIVAEGTQCA